MASAYLLNTQVKFPHKVFPEEIHVVENYNGGAVKKAQTLLPNGQWYTVWETSTVRKIDRLRTFIPEFDVSILPARI